LTIQDIYVYDSAETGLCKALCRKVEQSLLISNVYFGIVNLGVDEDI